MTTDSDDKSRDIRQALARALWRIDQTEEDAPAEGEEKPGFKAVKAEMITKATKLMVRLEKEGITLSSSK